MLTRRAFLGTPVLLAGPAQWIAASRLFGAASDSKLPVAALENLASVALREAKKQKATYCDVRICRYRDQSVSIRQTTERGTGRAVSVPRVVEDSSFGFGVRVIVNGAWGFASSPIVTQEEIARVTGEAVTVAKANATMQPKPVQLAPVKAYKDRWTSPVERDPFAVPLAEKIELLQGITATIKKNQKVFASIGNVMFRAEEKYFASSEGSSIQQSVTQSFAQISGTAVDFSKALSRTRSYVPPSVSSGWEYVPLMNLGENAERVREEVLEHLTAPAVTEGKKDLVLLPSHLFLTIHESVGHPTELDRALGYEANYAGTSYITPDKIGQRIASDLVTFYGDRTLERGLATIGYDDDGVKTTRFPIIEKGIFRHYQTVRDQAHLVGEKESRGCSFADSWATVPFQRMPNVWLEAGDSSVTLDSLISGVDDGVLIDGRGSYSIDQQRYNFQFGGDAFWEIKGGKKRGMISRVSYQARTPDFWQACDGIAGKSYWQPYGTSGDAKGEPTQINAMTHGCSPARFRQVNVIVTD